jgi:hypothetical protein
MITRAGILAAAVAALALPGAAVAHIERPSYWPDPGPETVEGLPVGGAVPEARSLQSALDRSAPGETFVVCQGEDGQASLRRLRRSIRRARTDGYRIRPSQPTERLGARDARRLLRINERLAARCDFDSVQAAVFAAGNHDRVVVLPGRYTEPGSRSKPTNDPTCAEMTQRDQTGAITPSYRYQTSCPNDQNLVYVQGRAVPDEPPPSPPLDNRQGIPDEGACLRCNLQLEGSGVVPEDVIIDGGTDYTGRGPEARPGGYAKHVTLRVDRADGFVVKNLLTRGASEHGIYVEETDGYRLDTVKFFWAADYGNLTFTSDHGLYTDCDGFGAGDAVVYPGAAPETGEQADRSFYPDAPRINTTVTRCDLRGSGLAYSGSMGNSVRITGNHIYGNIAGIATDSISAGGHPGFPADSVQVDHNLIYSNNLNLYVEGAPVEPRISVPVGTGIIWGGHNNGRVHDNYIFDNWRQGTMLTAVPDAVVEPEGQVNEGVSCANPLVTTSCGNRYHDNVMGQAPPGFQFPDALDQFGVAHGATGGPLPNGVDFWWDEFPGNTGNCWFDNVGPDGSRDSLTADPPLGPAPGSSVPSFLPEGCDSSVGFGDVFKEAVLVDCALGVTGDDPLLCDWHETPPAPGSGAARRERAAADRASRRFERSPAGRDIRRKLEELGGRAARR